MFVSCPSLARLAGVFLFLGALLGFAAPATAQIELKVGLKEGGHFGTFAGEHRVEVAAPEAAQVDLGRRPGFVIGGLAIVDPPGLLAIQPEVLWIWKGAQVTADGTTTTTKLNYIEVPVLARYQLPVSTLSLPTRDVRAHLVAGPTVGFVTQAEREQKTKTARGRTSLMGRTDLRSVTRSLDVGIAVGIELGYRFSEEAMLTMDVRYRRSFTSVLNRPEAGSGGTSSPGAQVPDAQHQGVGLTLGWIYSPGWTVSFD